MRRVGDFACGGDQLALGVCSISETIQPEICLFANHTKSVEVESCIYVPISWPQIVWRFKANCGIRGLKCFIKGLYIHPGGIKQWLRFR